MTFEEYYSNLKQIYRDLMMEANWKLNDIDNMDINYFLELLDQNGSKKLDDIEEFYKSI
ncbi:hypothetical protein [Bacillus smithii]|uniref:hypothetical protein n=1 Tax=Bacillus smithii TaxID=1479 RepID=UPI003D25260E